MTSEHDTSFHNIFSMSAISVCQNSTKNCILVVDCSCANYIRFIIDMASSYLIIKKERFYVSFHDYMSTNKTSCVVALCIVHSYRMHEINLQVRMQANKLVQCAWLYRDKEAGFKTSLTQYWTRIKEAIQ